MVGFACLVEAYSYFLWGLYRLSCNLPDETVFVWDWLSKLRLNWFESKHLQIDESESREMNQARLTAFQSYFIQTTSQINYFSCLQLTALVNLILILDLFLIMRNPFYPRNKRMRKYGVFAFVASACFFG